MTVEMLALSVITLLAATVSARSDTDSRR